MSAKRLAGKSGCCHCFYGGVREHVPGSEIRLTALAFNLPSSIGYSIAQRLVRDGAKVMVSSRKQENVTKAVQRLRGEDGSEVDGMVCHVGQAEHRRRLIKEVVSKFGGLDIVVSNAAVNPAFGPTLAADESVWDKILDINIKAAALLVKEAHPHLKARGSGSVVLVSSIGAYVPFSLLGPYSVSKTALLGLTKVLATELAPDNIRVNCIAPGIIKTKFSSALWSNDTMHDAMIQQIPMNRIGSPDECAGTVSFLCCDDAAYITGESIVIAGGQQSRL